MSNLAVELVIPEGEIFNGILIADPKVGHNCRIYIGSDRIYQVARVRGWIKLCGSDNCILFDKEGRRFKLTVIASSEEFL